MSVDVRSEIDGDVESSTPVWTAFGDLASLPEKAAIHLNDTHPAIAVPELMRLLMDVHGIDTGVARRRRRLALRRGRDLGLDVRGQALGHARHATRAG